MAIRHKTVAFASAPLLNLVDATLTDLPTFSARIHEIGAPGTTILECWVELSCWDVVTATGGTVTETRVGLSINGAAPTVQTDFSDFAQTGENLAFVIGPLTFTSQATVNWTTNIPVNVVVSAYLDQNTGTTLGMANVSAILYVTYAYDDNPAVNPIQTKTVMVPLDSRQSTLPTAQASFGDGIPNLTATVMPESTVTALDWFMLIEGNEATANTTDWTLNCSIDGGTPFAFRTQEAALQSDRYGRWIYKPAIPDISASHTFEMWSAAQARANHICATLFCTYSFDATTTTRIGNSLLLPIEIATPLGQTAAADASRFTRRISVQEPNPSLQQSGFRINFNTASSITALNFRAGAQAYRAYTNIANVACGMYSLQRRIDSGAAGGAGFSIVRGYNDIVIDGFSTDAADQATNLSGYILLNYTSDVPAQGIGAASHTVFRPLQQWNATLVDFNRFINKSFPIPEADYFIVGAGFMVRYHQSASANAITFDVECLPAEGKGLGYYDIYTDVMQTDAERGFHETWMRGRDVFIRYPADPDPERIDPEASRDYRLFFAATTGCGVMQCVTYHSMTWSVDGTISGHDPALASEVRLLWSGNDELRQVATLGAGVTAISFDVHDNTEDYYVSVFQDSTHVGRSASGKAV